jgi:hypothetical protein
MNQNIKFSKHHFDELDTDIIFLILGDNCFRMQSKNLTSLDRIKFFVSNYQFQKSLRN